jgi:hypothetical protein
LAVPEGAAAAEGAALEGAVAEGAAAEGAAAEGAEAAGAAAAEAQAALGLQVLHARGGATRARAVSAAAANKFAPLYVPSAELLASVSRFYGLGPSFPLHRLLVRSMQGLTLVLVAEEVL